MKEVIKKRPFMLTWIILVLGLFAWTNIVGYYPWWNQPEREKQTSKNNNRAYYYRNYRNYHK